MFAWQKDGARDWNDILEEDEDADEEAFNDMKVIKKKLKDIEFEIQKQEKLLYNDKLKEHA